LAGAHAEIDSGKAEIALQKGKFSAIFFKKMKWMSGMVADLFTP